MLNSGSIQSHFSSSQESPFPQFCNHDHQDYSNTNSKYQENPLFHFPMSPIFSQMQDTIHGNNNVVDHQENRNNNNSINQLEKPCEVINPTKRRNLASSSRRKTGKKSRHSKICTAQGVRDRRMRLSLPISRKFFGLQDLLGFDKPSKTIEWLFSNSQKAIKDLQIKNLPQEKDSWSYEAKFMYEDFEVKLPNDVEENPMNENDITKSRKSLGYSYSHAKQSRERARERARERTREKMKIKEIKQWFDELNPSKDDLEYLGHVCPFEDLTSYDTQFVGASHEKDSNSTSFMENFGNFKGYNNNSVISTMGLVTGDDLDVSTYCMTTRKFPFLLQ